MSYYGLFHIKLFCLTSTQAVNSSPVIDPRVAALYRMEETEEPRKYKESVVCTVYTVI